MFAKYRFRNYDWHRFLKGGRSIPKPKGIPLISTNCDHKWNITHLSISPIGKYLPETRFWITWRENFCFSKESQNFYRYSEENENFIWLFHLVFDNLSKVVIYFFRETAWRFDHRMPFSSGVSSVSFVLPSLCVYSMTTGGKTTVGNIYNYFP